MTTLGEMPAAWLVLEDCGRAVELAVKAEGDTWRLHWAGALALLRAVGHVMDKVDGHRSPAHRACADAWWDRWHPKRGTETRPNIFADFIEEERNNILKQYDLRFDPRERPPRILRSEAGAILLSTGGVPLASNRRDRFVLTGGQFQGEDGRELLHKAIRWWTVELEGVEHCIRARGQGSSGGP